MRTTPLKPEKLIFDNVSTGMEPTVDLPAVRNLPRKLSHGLLPWLVCWHSWRQRRIVLEREEMLQSAQFVWRTMKLGRSYLDWSVCANSIRIALWIGLKERLSARCTRFPNGIDGTHLEVKLGTIGRHFAGPTWVVFEKSISWRFDWAWCLDY